MILSVNTVDNWQYVMVIIVVLAAIAWIIYKLLTHKHSKSSCCGCSMSNICDKGQSANKQNVDKSQCNKQDADVPDCCKKIENKSCQNAKI